MLSYSITSFFVLISATPRAAQRYKSFQLWYEMKYVMNETYQATEMAVTAISFKLPDRSVVKNTIGEEESDQQHDKQIKKN